MASSSSRVKNPFKKGGVSSSSSHEGDSESQPMNQAGNEESNPFESGVNALPPPSSSAQGAWGQQPASTTEDEQVVARSTNGLSQEELSMREANIKSREERLRQKENQLDERARNIGATLYPNNWPCRWWAFAYNDIPSDIPDDKQAFVRRFYRALLFTYFVLTFNAITVLVTIGEGCTSFTSFLWAIIYCLCGFVIGWHWWYKPIYEMNRKNSGGLRWVLFFAVFGIHWVFLVLLIIGYNSGGGAGIFAVLQDLSNSCKASALFAIADTIFAGLLFLWSSYLMQAAWRDWRKGGGSLKGMTTDATNAAARTATKHALNNV